MCQAALESVKQYMKPATEEAKDKLPKTAADVPLGDGMAGQALMSIMSRRQRIEAALEEAERGTR